MVFPVDMQPVMRSRTGSKAAEMGKSALAGPKFSTLSTDFSTKDRREEKLSAICILVNISFFDQERSTSHFLYVQHVDNKVFSVPEIGS